MLVLRIGRTGPLLQFPGKPWQTQIIYNTYSCSRKNPSFHRMNLGMNPRCQLQTQSTHADRESGKKRNEPIKPPKYKQIQMNPTRRKEKYTEAPKASTCSLFQLQSIKQQWLIDHDRSLMIIDHHLQPMGGLQFVAARHMIFVNRSWTFLWTSSTSVHHASGTPATSSYTCLDDGWKGQWEGPIAIDQGASARNILGRKAGNLSSKEVESSRLNMSVNESSVFNGPPSSDTLPSDLVQLGPTPFSLYQQVALLPLDLQCPEKGKPLLTWYVRQPRLWSALPFTIISSTCFFALTAIRLCLGGQESLNAWTWLGDVKERTVPSQRISSNMAPKLQLDMFRTWFVDCTTLMYPDVLVHF